MHANFADLGVAAAAHGVATVRAVLLDLGVSSAQLETSAFRKLVRMGAENLSELQALADAIAASVETGDVPRYPAGSWGPREAEALLAPSGAKWRE